MFLPGAGTKLLPGSRVSFGSTAANSAGVCRDRRVRWSTREGVAEEGRK